jgi:hypothetical protein
MTTELIKALRLEDTMIELAVNAACNPGQSAHLSQMFGGKSFTRDDAVRLWGEQAGLSWDDIQSSIKAFRKSCISAKEQTR